MTTGLRDSFATPLFEEGYNIRTMPELLGHKDVGPTLLDTPVRNRSGQGVRRPLDRPSEGLAHGGIRVLFCAPGE